MKLQIEKIGIDQYNFYVEKLDGYLVSSDIIIRSSLAMRIKEILMGFEITILQVLPGREEALVGNPTDQIRKIVRDVEVL